MARTFAALLDQESVVLLEYRTERDGFRLLDTRSRAQHFASPEGAVDAVVSMLADMNAKNATLSVVLQHFGSFFHTLVLPTTDPQHIRPIIQREIQRSFNIADPALAFSMGSPIERRDAARAEGPPPRQIFVAGAPQSVVDAIEQRFAKAKIRVQNLTVAPEVFRRLYESLDASKEATAFLVCLQNGPHVAFFVNGQLELAIEPPLTLEGEAPLDTNVVIDQLERGAIFLRQQARGAVATRLLLSASSDAYESLAETIEARTGMHVAPLGQGIGSPESVVAMGAVLAARSEDRLDLFPRPPAFDERLKSAMSGPGLFTTTLFTAAAVAAFWAGMQVLTVRREQRSLEDLQSRVERALPALAGARQSAQGRERIASIRNALRDAGVEKAAVTSMMAAVSTGPQSGTQLDSLRISRVVDGLRTTLFGHATAPSGPAAMSAATNFYRRFKSGSGLKDAAFESAFTPRQPAGTATPGGPEELKFTISAISPISAK
jgi:hypothetical protein